MARITTLLSSTSLIPSSPLAIPAEPLCPNLPVEVLERIVDMCSGDTEILSNVSQSCRSLLYRCRFHLFVHIHIHTMEQMRSITDFLENRPWIRPLIHQVSISPSDTCEYMIPAHERQALFMVVPLPLLKLPNLDHWAIIGGYKATKAPSLNRSASSGFGHYGIHIRHLTFRNFTFPNCASFGRLLLAFPGIQHLDYSACRIATDVPYRGDEVIRQRLIKRLHLTRLSIQMEKTDKIFKLLLATSHTTLEHLSVLSDADINMADKLENITEAIMRFSSLKSLSVGVAEFTDPPLSGPGSGSYSRDTMIPKLTQLLDNIRGIKAKDPHRLEVTVILASASPLHNLYCFLSRDVTLDARRKLETTLRNSSLRPTLLVKSLGRTTSYAATSYRTSFWKARSRQLFPELHRESRLRIECPDTFTDSAPRHEGKVHTLVASPNGHWFASGSNDSTIIIWDSRSGTIVYDWVAHEHYLHSLAFSPDGRYLCSTGDDNTPKVWDLHAHATLVTTLVGHTDTVECCSWSSSGALIATGSRDGSVRVWGGTLARCGVCHEIPGIFTTRRWSKTRVSGVQFSPDASWFFAIHRPLGPDAYPCFNLWHFTGSQVVEKDFGWASAVTVAAFDTRSCRLATISVHVESICLWDLKTSGKKLAIIPFSNPDSNVLDGAIKVVFSSDQCSILTLRRTTGAPYRKLELWDTESGRLKAVFDDEFYWSPCFSPDGSYIAAGFYDGFHLWRTSDGSCGRVLTIGRSLPYSHCAFTACGQRVAYAPNNSTTQAYTGFVIFVACCSLIAHNNSRSIVH